MMVTIVGAIAFRGLRKLFASVLKSLRSNSRLLLLLIFPTCSALAHPMDFGTLDVRVLGDRMQVSLKLHVLAAMRAEGLSRLPDDQGLTKLSDQFFSSTLGKAVPTLGGDLCQWRRPELQFADPAHLYLELKNVAVCPQARTNLFGLQFPLPFLGTMPPAFQLIAHVTGRGDPVTALVTGRSPSIVLGPQENRTFTGFFRLGMGHIGALPEEWRTNEGTFRFPEGLDHIFFVLALVVAESTLWELLKSASGFTLGHSATLGLSALKILHVHSHWVEAFIALSIACMAGLALFRPRSGHHWVVAAAFGTVHGLGFASAVQELNFSQERLLPILFGFNLGVEAGQCAIICLTLAPLLVLRKASPTAYLWSRRLAATALLILGTHWFLVRAIN